MEDLDFGWGLAVTVLLIYGIVYFFIVAINYIITYFLGRQLKVLLDKLLIKRWRTDKLTFTGLPFFIASAIICFTIIKFVLFAFNEASNQYTAPGGVLFWEPFLFFYNGYIGYSVGLTCLSLTSFSFTKDWSVIGRLKKRMIISNFFLWTILNLFNTFFCKYLSDFFFSYTLFIWIYSIATIITTFSFIKWRNLNRPIKEKKTISNNV